ncbi:MAG TPA: OmpA family protein [Bryobacteraceae bacterium]|nr:OmpA family protein [Bryobacteraceae bacterium]
MGFDRSRKNIGVVALAVGLSVFAAGCRKKPAPAPPPPPPPKEAPAPQPTAARPTIGTFEAEPSAVERGQAATLRWTVTGETTEIRIEPGIGSVSASGNRQVFPGTTTAYTLTATGPGGTATASASVNVTAAQAPPAPTAKPRMSASEMLDQNVQDALFDYDSSTINETARAVLSRNAEALKQLFQEHPNVAVVVEGHADERGSAEYNLGLADRRATAAKEFLVQLGVGADRLKPVSYGRERPQCTESTEDCWQRNRRAHFSLGQ